MPTATRTFIYQRSVAYGVGCLLVINRRGVVIAKHDLRRVRWWPDHMRKKWSCAPQAFLITIAPDSLVTLVHGNNDGEEGCSRGLCRV
jgi:hypothetical protein